MPATGTLQSVTPIRQFATSRSRAWPAADVGRVRRSRNPPDRLNECPPGIACGVYRAILGGLSMSGYASLTRPTQLTAFSAVRSMRGALPVSDLTIKHPIIGKSATRTG